MKNRAARVTLFSSRGCPHCIQARKFLQRHGILFRELNVETSRRALNEFRRAGGLSVPLIRIGEQQLSGFDSRQLIRLLRQSGFHV